MEKLYRAILKNRATNYYFLCGGTFEEIKELLNIEDEKRNDGKVCSIALENLKNYLERKTEYEFANFSFSNGLEIVLLNAGVKQESIPLSDAANLLLNLLKLKENNKNDGE